MPWSMKGLLRIRQGCQESGWKKGRDETLRSGLCLGFLFGNARSFKPKMRLHLTVDNMFHMLTSNDTKITSNGYIILDIINSPEAGWTTSCDTNTPSNQTEDSDEDDSQDEYDHIDSVKRVALEEMKEEERSRIFQQISEAKSASKARTPTST